MTAHAIDFKHLLQGQVLQNPFGSRIVWETREILNGIVGSLMGGFTSDIAESEVKALEAHFGARLQYCEVLSIPQPSDERCEMHVLLLDGEAVATFVPCGDKSDYRDDVLMLAPKACTELATVVLRARMEAQVKDAKPVTFDEVMGNLGAYLTHLGRGLFIVDDPRSAGGAFTELFKRYKSVLLGTDGACIDVAGFSGWMEKQDHPDNADLPKHFALLGSHAYGQMAADTRRIVFSLAGNIQDEDRRFLSDLLSKPDSWVLTDVSEVRPTRFKVRAPKGESEAHDSAPRILMTGYQHYRGLIRPVLFFLIATLSPKDGKESPNLTALLEQLNCREVPEGIFGAVPGVVAFDCPEFAGLQFSPDSELPTLDAPYVRMLGTPV